MDNYIGQMLDGRYEILEIIGSGGMAVVYKALCHRLNRLVAIKILKKDFGQDAELHRRFQTESQAVAMLSHPNIVSVYDVSSSPEMDYIVMELIDGITLKQYMQKKGVLSWREALHFSIQIASALEHAHSRGIIHRDIKPHNIMVLKDGSIKVADFGIARVASSQNTLTRETLGSVHYISPEQARGGRVDQRTDLYSLGVVMYEMLTGQLPYDGDTAVSIAIQHIGGKCRRPREINPEIPVGLEQITLHAMAVNLDERYENASQMYADLEEFRKNQSVVFPYAAAPAVQPQEQPAQQQPARQPEQEPARGGGRTVTVIILLCMLLAFVGIGYFLYSYILKDLFSTSVELQAPNLLGVYYTSLSDERYSDFQIEVEKWAYSEEVEYGYVIEQDPQEGKKVKQGATIRVVISQGAQENVMPQVTNLNQTAAEQMLRALDLDLELQVEKEYSNVFVAGQVIRSSPETGAPLKNGDTVTLYVSLGSEVELVPVPKLVGENIEDALQMIEEAGLRQGVVTYHASEEPKDTVIYQSTSEGIEVKKTTMINLRVSLGPEEEEEDGEGDMTAPDEPENNPPDSGGVADPEPSQPGSSGGSSGDDDIIEFDQGNPKPDEYTRQTIEVTLPVGVGTMTISVLCDGVQYGSPFIVDLSHRVIRIAVYGSGTHEFDVLANGTRCYFASVTF